MAQLSDLLLVHHPETLLSRVLSLECSVQDRCVDTADKNKHWFSLQNGLYHFWEEHHRRHCLIAEWPELLTVSLLAKIFWEKLALSCSWLAQQLKSQDTHWTVTLMCLDHSKVKPLLSSRMKLYFILHFPQPIVLVQFPLFSLHMEIWWIKMLSFLCLQKRIIWEKCFCLIASGNFSALKLLFQMLRVPWCPEMFMFQERGWPYL